MRLLERRAPGTTMRALIMAVLLTSAVAGGAHAQSTIADCEKITAADAYNQCLAKFGPESKVKSLEPEKPSDFKGSAAEAAATAGAAKGGRAAHHARAGRGRSGRAAGGGGRKRMVISVGRRHHR